MSMKPAGEGAGFGVALTCRWLSSVPETLLLFGVIVLAIAWISSPQSGPLHQEPTNMSFFAVPVRPPGTSGAVALYTTHFVNELQKPGYLDYVPNPLMTQGKRETVTIAVALTEDELKGIRDKTFASARDKFGQTGADTVETELISVSSSMSARLTGSPNLQIKELSTQEQLITSENPTIWHWEVLPTDSGEAELYLVLSNHNRSSDGYPGAKDLEPIRKSIHVTISPLYSVQRLFTNNLAVLVGLSSLIAGLAKVPWKKVPSVFSSNVGFFKRRGRSIWHRLNKRRRRPT
jgi:hypothetical protein